MNKKVRYICVDKAIKLYQQLEVDFPTEEECREELLKYTTVRCTHCGFEVKKDKIAKDEDYKKTKCERCKRITWLTANTFFHSVKRHRAYLFMLKLLENGLVLSASDFERIAKVANSTAQLILKKFALLFVDRLDRLPKSVCTSLFARRLFRRTKHSPPKQHPTGEFLIRPALVKAANKRQKLKLEKVNASAREVYRRMGHKRVDNETVSAKTGLSEELVKTSISALYIEKLVAHAGGAWWIKKHPVKALMSETVVDDESANAIMLHKTLIKKFHHGISRKYLQLYLVLFWCFIDRETWSQWNLHQIISKKRYIRRDDMYAYSSQDKVVLCTLAA